MQNLRTTEPLRLGGWVALAVGLALQGAILWSVETPPRGIVGALATLAATQVAGLEWVRARVTPWSPPPADLDEA